MSNETFLIQQNDSIKGLPNEIKVGKTEVEPEVFYGHPCQCALGDLWRNVDQTHEKRSATSAENPYAT